MATPEEMREWTAKKMGWQATDTGNYWYENENGVATVSLKMNWTPDIDHNQCFMLVDRMRELGLYLTIYTDINSYTAVFRTVDSSGRFWSAPLEINLCHAIILAAMATEDNNG